MEAPQHKRVPSPRLSAATRRPHSPARLRRHSAWRQSRGDVWTA